ncbi:MAG: hypothetical protein HY424_01850 [Candidatus Levybacteria bacterium]|nr:hypothetical protein [Candidatus Levybacteria bacterium]
MRHLNSKNFFLGKTTNPHYRFIQIVKGDALREYAVISREKIDLLVGVDGVLHTDSESEKTPGSEYYEFYLRNGGGVLKRIDFYKLSTWGQCLDYVGSKEREASEEELRELLKMVRMSREIKPRRFGIF